MLELTLASLTMFVLFWAIGWIFSPILGAYSVYAWTYPILYIILGIGILVLGVIIPSIIKEIIAIIRRK